jgi:quinol monooxygenase YgiN
MFFEFWKKASSMKLYSQTDHFRTRFGQISGGQFDQIAGNLPVVTTIKI